MIFPVKDGIRFLGYRVFPTHRLLPKENVRRFRRRVRRMQRGLCGGPGFLRGNLPAAHELESATPGKPNTYRLRCRLFDTISFQRATTV